MCFSVCFQYPLHRYRHSSSFIIIHHHSSIHSSIHHSQINFWSPRVDWIWAGWHATIFAMPNLHEPLKMTSVAGPVPEQQNQDPDPHPWAYGSQLCHRGSSGNRGGSQWSRWGLQWSCGGSSRLTSLWLKSKKSGSRSAYKCNIGSTRCVRKQMRRATQLENP